MTPVSPLSLRALARGASLLCLLLGAGCGGSTSQPPAPEPGPEVPDAARSSVELSPAQGARANGADAVEVRVTVRTAAGSALPGLGVTVAVEGEGVSVVQPAAATDAQGVATARVTATAAGSKTVTATVAGARGAVVLAARPAVAFVALPASRLAFAAPVGDAVAGAPLAEVAVQLQDADGRTVTGATGQVTLSLGAGPAGASLGGTLTAAAVDGVARFPGLHLERAAQGYTLLARSEGLTGATSAAFSVAPAALASLALTATPAEVVAGGAVDLQVTARDAFGNTVTGYRGTVRFGSGAADVLPADYTFVAADGGQHTFSGAVVPTSAGVRVLTVTDSGASPSLTAQAQLGVLPGAAHHLAFRQAPGEHSVRAPFGVQVDVQDAHGNTVPTADATVSLALSPTGTLSGTTTVGAVGGVASFTGLSVAQERADWVLAASAPGLQPAASAPFRIRDDVLPATPALALAASTATTLTVGWTAVGDDGTLGAVAQHALRYATAPIVTDADFDAATPVALGAPGAAGGAQSATLSGLAPHTTYSVALQVTDDAGNRVRSAALSVSTAFATAARLALLDQPAGGTAGTALPGLRVAVQDADGLLVDQADSAITLSVEGVSGFGPWTVAASNGVATFSGVRIDRAGVDYRLVARSGGLTDATSQRFAVTHAAAARLVMDGLAADVTAGAAQSVGVTVKDAFDNTVVDATGTLTLTSSDGAATLPPAHALTAAEQGQHTFGGIAFATGGVQTLTASAPGLVAGTQSTRVDDPTPRALVLTGLPAQVTAGVAVTLTLEARDASGRVAPGYRGTVRLTADDGAAGLPADQTFTEADAGRRDVTVTLRTAGARTVRATDVASASLTAAADTVVGWAPVAALVLEAPADATAGSPFSATVHARDAFGNAVKDYAGTVHFTATDAQAGLPPDSAFAAADEGSRLFPVTLVLAGSTTLGVADAAAGLADTASVSVGAGAVSQLVLTAAAGPVTAGADVALTVGARDAWANPVPGYTGTVHFTSSDARAVLPADTAFTGADAGQRAFSASLRTAGAQQLAVVDTAQAFLHAELQRDVVPGAPSALRFVDAPAGGTVRAALAPSRVEVLDGFDNRVTVATSTVTLSLTGGNATATLAGTTGAAPTDGVATFADLSVDQQGAGFQLRAEAAGLDGVSSAAFAITDDLAPGVPSLSVTEAQQTRLTLGWLAVGDDGSLGRASTQELRYATAALTAETFGTGTPVAVGAPAASGAAESVTVDGLAVGTTYHFALRVSDDAGNVRHAFLQAATLADPCAGVTCTPSADACAADGTTRLTFTAACVAVSGAPTCQETSTPEACPGADAVCVQGACGTAPRPAAAELVVTEVMHAPSVGTTEYVELANTTAHALNLDGVTVSFAGAGAPGSFTLGSGAPVVLAAGARYVLAQSADAAVNGGVAADAAYGTALSLEGDGTLSVSRGTTALDSLAYTPSFPQTPGRAMGLADAIVGTRASARPWYWCDATDVLSGGDRGTPRAANGSCGLAVQAPLDSCAIQFPKAFAASVTPGSASAVYGQFYEPGATDRNTTGNDDYPHVLAELGYGTGTDVTTWTWSDAPLDAAFAGAGNNDQVVGTLSIPTAGSYLYGFRYRVRDPATGALSGYTYCDQSGVAVPPAGTWGTVTVASAPPPGTASHVVISEFSGGNGTGTAATDEFVELYNPTDVPVDLNGWTVQYKSATGTTYAGSVTLNATTAPGGTIIQPHGYFLIAGANYSGAAVRDATHAFDASASTTAGGHVRIGPGLVGTNTSDPNTVDKLAWGTGNSPEGTAGPAHPAVGGSLERKAVSTSTPATMAVGGSDAARGNGQDTDNNAADIVTRTVRNPQSSASGVEVP